MLLTVFGMLSGNGNKRQKLNAQACESLRLFFFFDYCFKTRKHCLYTLGQVSWLVTLLPSFSSALKQTMDLVKATIFCVTYSCATARDLHTVPF